MKKNKVSAIALSIAAMTVMLGTAGLARAADDTTPYPAMAPVDQYMMDRNAEIALARTAAPDSISRDAEILVMDHHGYETAVKGKNGFVCVVERSWTAGPDNPNFWNPKLRGPICFNAAAARSYLPRTIKKTELILAGRTKTQMLDAIAIAIQKKELPEMEPGAMCYMLSKQGYLDDQAGHWHPHLMFFTPIIDTASWGADLPGSPILSDKEEFEHVTTFMVPVLRWSDGTPDLEPVH